MSKDADRRTEEARKLLGQLRGHGPDMRENDRLFYSKMLDAFTCHAWPSNSYRAPQVTKNQLFWLRDLRDRYVLGTED